MKFEWDENKNRINFEKHGMDFEHAKYIFENPTLISIDNRFQYDEVREVALGKIKDLILAVVFTRRTDNIIRLISARPANKKERNLYEKQAKN